jgi:hypothetical protein
MTDKVTIERFLYCLESEYRGAMRKFPDNECNTDALMEEVGELAKALLHLQQEPTKPDATRPHVYAEAVQVAAMAMKIALHGSSQFPAYYYGYDCYQEFKAT